MKVKFGLRNVHYSKITVGSNGQYTYETPVKIPGAVNLSASASGDSNDFFADDSKYFNDTANQGYEGDLEVALIPESFLTDILGEVKDSNGALIENADARTSAFALLFEVQGDVKGRRICFYNCTASRPNQDASTMENSKTPATQTISVQMMPRLSDKKVKAILPLTDENKTTYDSFFESVYETPQSI